MRLTGDFFFLDTYNIYCAVVIVKFSAARACRVLFGVSWCIYAVLVKRFSTGVFCDTPALAFYAASVILVIVRKGYNKKER